MIIGILITLLIAVSCNCCDLYNCISDKFFLVSPSTISEAIRKFKDKETASGTDSDGLKLIEEATVNHRMYMALDDEGQIKILRKRIGHCEFIIFSVITFLVFYKPHLWFDLKSISDDLKLLLECMGGWFTIKSLGTFRYWDNPITGRILFYKYLLGTVSLQAGESSR